MGNPIHGGRPAVLWPRRYSNNKIKAPDCKNEWKKSSVIKVVVKIWRGSNKTRNVRVKPFKAQLLPYGAKDLTLTLTRQAMYVLLYIEARSCNHCCSGKSISITNSECVFVALVIQYAVLIQHIVISGLSGSKLFFYPISQTTRFKKRSVNIRCVSWFSP
jgi:hypothetical protein